jgi:methylated-DNA-protein-cysteine methyltransferase related protein
MSTAVKIYKVVSQIPKGKVLTYKKAAEMSGISNPRQVGYYLHKNLTPKTVPCHRVIKSDGTLATGYAFGGMKKQKEILQKEGVEIPKNGKIDLERFLFNSRL